MQELNVTEVAAVTGGNAAILVVVGPIAPILVAQAMLQGAEQETSE